MHRDVGGEYGITRPRHVGGHAVLVLVYGLLGDQSVLVVSQSDHRDWFQDTLPAVVKPQCPAVELQNFHETAENA